MPDPGKFKDKDKWMNACMHTTLHVEKKDRDQAIAQCLAMWRDKGKKKKSKKRQKTAAGIIRQIAESLCANA